MNSPGSSQNPLVNVSFKRPDQPAEVTVDLITSSTVCSTSIVQVGDGTNAGNTGTITVDSEDQDATLDKSKVSSPPTETVIDSSTKGKDNDLGLPEKVSTQVPPKTTPDCADVNSSDTSEPLLSPSNVSGSILVPEGTSTSFLDKTTNNTVGPLLQKYTKLHHKNSSSSENANFGFFQQGTLNWIPTFVDKGDEQNISALEPQPDASTKFIAIPTEFPTVPPYKTFKGNVVSIQDSLQTS